MRLDHIVLWVEDPLASVAFYEEVLGVHGVRVDAYREQKVPFPSVRIAEDTIVDLMPKAASPMLNGLGPGSAGNLVNHVCFAMSKSEYEALRERLRARGTDVPFTMKGSFGARGEAPEAFYFRDPDGNVLEARYYE